MTLTSYIQDHPLVALLVGSVHIITAEHLKDIEVPTIVMQLFQIGAWSITIAVGVITISGFLKKRKKK